MHSEIWTFFWHFLIGVATEIAVVLATESAKRAGAVVLIGLATVALVIIVRVIYRGWLTAPALIRDAGEFTYTQIARISEKLVRNLLLLAGIDLRYAVSPRERGAKFRTVFAISLTTIFAFISSSIILSDVADRPGIIYFGSSFYAVAIFLLDCMIAADDIRFSNIVLARIALAITISVVVTPPLLVTLFQSTVTAQLIKTGDDDPKLTGYNESVNQLNTALCNLQPPANLQNNCGGTPGSPRPLAPPPLTADSAVATPDPSAGILHNSAMVELMSQIEAIKVRINSNQDEGGRLQTAITGETLGIPYKNPDDPTNTLTTHEGCKDRCQHFQDRLVRIQEEVRRLQKDLSDRTKDLQSAEAAQNVRIRENQNVLTEAEKARKAEEEKLAKTIADKRQDKENLQKEIADAQKKVELWANRDFLQKLDEMFVILSDGSHASMRMYAVGVLVILFILDMSVVLSKLSKTRVYDALALKDEERMLE